MDKNVKTSQPYQLSEKCYKNNVIFHQSNLQKKKKKNPENIQYGTDVGKCALPF